MLRRAGGDRSLGEWCGGGARLTRVTPPLYFGGQIAKLPLYRIPGLIRHTFQKHEMGAKPYSVWHRE